MARESASASVSPHGDGRDDDKDANEDVLPAKRSMRGRMRVDEGGRISRRTDSSSCENRIKAFGRVACAL